jgi:tetratricopeptide (TPR) repeat protein
MLIAVTHQKRTSAALVVVLVVCLLIVIGLAATAVAVAARTLRTARGRGLGRGEAPVAAGLVHAAFAPFTVPARMRAQMLEGRDRPGRAVRAHARLGRLCSRLGDRLGEAQAFRDAARLSGRTDFDDSTFTFFGRAARAYESAGAARQAARVWSEAALSGYVEEPDSALAAVRRSLAAARDRRRSADALVEANAGFVFHACGEYDSAARHYITADRVPGAAKERDRLDCYLGAMIAEKGSEWMETAGALAGLDRNQTWGMHLRATAADSAVRADDARPLALRGAASDGYDSMIIRYSSAIDSAIAEADTATWQLQTWLLGKCCIDAGRPEGAVNALSPAFALSNDARWSSLRSAVASDLADAYRRLGSTDSAIRYFREAADASRRIGQRPYSDTNAWNMHLLFRQCGEQEFGASLDRLGISGSDSAELLRRSRVADQPVGG